MTALDDYNALMTLGGYQKIGFHVSVGGNRTGIGDYYRALDQASIPINLMSADDYGACKEVADISRASGVPHVVAYRLTTRGQNDGFDYDVPLYGSDPGSAARIHWQAVVAKLDPEFDKEKVWIVIWNEIDHEQSDWLGEAAYEYSQLTREQGYKAAFFGFASGEPEYDDWETPGMRKFLEECAKYPHLLAVSLHEYSYSVEDIKNGLGYLIGRVGTHLYDACDGMQIARPTVLISEWGWEAEDVPEADQAVLDVDEIADLYSAFPQILGAHIWYLGPGFGGIANQVQPLIEPVTDLTLTYEPPNTIPPGPEPPEPPEETLAQHIWRVTVDAQIEQGLHLNPNAALQAALLDESLQDPDDPVNIVINELRTDYDSTEYAAQAGERLESGRRYASYAEVPNWDQVVVITEPTAPPTGEFALTHRPTPSLQLTQRFGARPEYYGQFGLPGHDGVDISAQSGAPFFAAAPGEVYRLHLLERDGWHNYGDHVRLLHQDGYKTIYAHMGGYSQDLTVGAQIPGGTYLGESGNTGNTTWPHLHFGMKHPAGQPGWGYNLINPEPFLFALAPYIMPPGIGIDTLDYFTGGFTGNGVLYEVATQGVGQQRHQTQVEGNVFYHTKDHEWEQLRYDSDYIWRFTDTSPGDGHYYQLRDGGADWSKWTPRNWDVGDIYRRMPVVTFYNKSDCSVVGEPAIHDTWIKLVSVYAQYTFYTGVMLRNVIKLDWLSSPNSDPIESYWYAKGYGLVGWTGRGRLAAISEIHAPGARPDNEREVISCL
jgi:murein DD-endopeptidase MepM/ murein hydrolase activator NlpD